MASPSDKTLNEYTVKNLAVVLAVSIHNEKDIAFTSVCTDTRKIKKDCLFVALKGPNFDAHDYLQQAKDKGAVAAVVEKIMDCEIPQLKVDDTRLALGQMAKARRESFSGKVIGLTGSNGKTTVKELVTSILETTGEKVLATKGNFNNDIGLPLTLLALENNEKFAVIEMGANHLDEIKYLTNIARPDVALITNAGSAHLEGFGSLDGVAKGKGEIFGGLDSASGIAIINLDDSYSDYWVSLSSSLRQKTFSLHDKNADVFATDIKQGQAGSQFNLHIALQRNEAFLESSNKPKNTDKQIIAIDLPLSGKHNVANALVAAAAASECGVSAIDIKNGLENIKMVNGRLTFLQGENSSTIIDDTYNANLDSSKAAINVLKAQQGETYFVFGDLFESGDNAINIHQAVGEYAKEQNIAHVLTVGELTRHTVKSFGSNAQHFDSKEALVSFLMPKLNEKTAVLVKGSRGMKMEEIVKHLALNEKSSSLEIV